MSASIIYVGGYCNQNCLFCCGSSKKMPKSIYINIIKNCDGRLVISGGESIFSKELSSVFKLIKNNQKIKEVELQSNGAIFFYKNMVEKISKYNLVTEYNINFPTFDKKEDMIITQSNLFNHRLQGIKNLLDRKLNVRLTFVLTRLNCKCLYDYLKFIKENFNGLPLIQVSFVQIQGNVLKNLDIVPKYSEIKADLLKALEFARVNKLKLFIDNFPICISYPYNEINLDYVKKNNNEESFHSKIKVTCCKNCKLKDDCFGIPKDYLELYGNEEFKTVRD
jgi:MoaA/NifB/PqqE/SkfB family radical SAM enzyme